MQMIGVVLISFAVLAVTLEFLLLNVAIIFRLNRLRELPGLNLIDFEKIVNSCLDATSCLVWFSLFICGTELLSLISDHILITRLFQTICTLSVAHLIYSAVKCVCPPDQATVPRLTKIGIGLVVVIVALCVNSEKVAVAGIFSFFASIVYKLMATHRWSVLFEEPNDIPPEIANGVQDRAPMDRDNDYYLEWRDMIKDGTVVCRYKQINGLNDLLNILETQTSFRQDFNDNSRYYCRLAIVGNHQVGKTTLLNFLFDLNIPRELRGVDEGMNMIYLINKDGHPGYCVLDICGVNGREGYSANNRQIAKLARQAAKAVIFVDRFNCNRAVDMRNGELPMVTQLREILRENHGNMRGGGNDENIMIALTHADQVIDPIPPADTQRTDNEARAEVDRYLERWRISINTGLRGDDIQIAVDRFYVTNLRWDSDRTPLRRVDFDTLKEDLFQILDGIVRNRVRDVGPEERSVTILTQLVRNSGKYLMTYLPIVLSQEQHDMIKSNPDNQIIGPLVVVSFGAGIIQGLLIYETTIIQLTGIIMIAEVNGFYINFQTATTYLMHVIKTLGARVVGKTLVATAISCIPVLGWLTAPFAAVSTLTILLHVSDDIRRRGRELFRHN